MTQSKVCVGKNKTPLTTLSTQSWELPNQVLLGLRNVYIQSPVLQQEKHWHVLFMGGGESPHKCHKAPESFAVGMTIYVGTGVSPNRRSLKKAA